MNLQVSEATLAALLLGTSRAAGFVLFAPPFNSKSIAVPVKAAFALALSVALLITGNWTLSQLVSFTHDLFAMLPHLLGRV